MGEPIACATCGRLLDIDWSSPAEIVGGSVRVKVTCGCDGGLPRAWGEVTKMATDFRVTARIVPMEESKEAAVAVLNSDIAWGRIKITPAKDPVAAWMAAEWDGPSPRMRAASLARAVRRAESGPSAVAVAPPVQRGPVVYCQSQFDPDE